MVSATLRRQGILISKVKKRRTSGGRAIKQKDIAVFTRQLATMMRAGVPLLQSFDIVARGSPNPRLTKLLTDIRTDVETGTSLSAAFRKHPLYFDSLYCNLVEAGEAGGILETLLDRLAIYQEKTLAMKAKIKSALIYPVAVLVVAFVVIAIIMMFVIPVFKEVFTSFGADLPAPTLFVMGMSDIFVAVLVGHLRRPGRRHLLLLRVVETLREDAAHHGPPAAQGAGVRRPDQQGRRWPAGPARCPRCSPRACRWSRPSTRWAARPATRSSARPPYQIQTRRLHRRQPHHIDADHRHVPEHGAADVRHRRGIRRPRRHAGQGGRVLRGRGRRRRGRPVQPDGTVHHRDPRHHHRRHRGLDVPADLQARARWSDRRRWTRLQLPASTSSPARGSWAWWACASAAS